MHTTHSSALRRAARATLTGAALGLALPALAGITFYEHAGYQGRVVSTERAVRNFRNIGFNDLGSSAVVQGGRWEVCDDAGFGGRCMVLRPGNYASLGDMGLNDRVSSTRPADRRRTDAPVAPKPDDRPPYAYRQRPQERLYEANVTAVRAVMGPPTQRCWVERQDVERRGEPNAGRALLGAVLGGVIGHQIGGGTGRDLATAGGAVAGAVIGANSGRGGGGPQRDVQRCDTVPGAVPAYWDVDYNFRGVAHRLQMNSEPGATVRVNRDGEPRQ